MTILPHSQPIRRAAGPCAKYRARTIADRSMGPGERLPQAIALQPQDAHTARAFFEQNFQPVRIARLGEVQGLLTGYFEPIVAGSRFPNPEFPVPLYRRPRDLVAAGYKPGSTAFPNKGVRIGRRTGNNELVPYHDRGAIEAGALDGKSSRSAGSRIRSICSRSRSKARGAWSSRTARRCASATICTTAITTARSSAYSSSASHVAQGDVERAHPRLDGRVSGGSREGACHQPRLCVLPRYRADERGRAGRRAGRAVDTGPLHCRRPDA